MAEHVGVDASGDAGESSCVSDVGLDCCGADGAADGLAFADYVGCVGSVGAVELWAVWSEFDPVGEVFCEAWVEWDVAACSVFAAADFDAGEFAVEDELVCGEVDDFAAA